MWNPEVNGPHLSVKQRQGKVVDWPLLVDGEATGDEREVSVMPPARSMVTHPKEHDRGGRR